MSTDPAISTWKFWKIKKLLFYKNQNWFSEFVALEWTQNTYESQWTKQLPMNYECQGKHQEVFHRHALDVSKGNRYILKYYMSNDPARFLCIFMSNWGSPLMTNIKIFAMVTLFLGNVLQIFLKIKI